MGGSELGPKLLFSTELGPRIAEVKNKKTPNWVPKKRRCLSELGPGFATDSGDSVDSSSIYIQFLFSFSLKGGGKSYTA